jgi:DNA-binding Lrp family transcriptional regulator
MDYLQDLRLDGIDLSILGIVSQKREISFSQLRHDIPAIPESTLLYRVKNLVMDGRLAGFKDGRRLVLQPIDN